MKPRITSEFKPLKKVMIHTPGAEHQQLIPWEGDHPLMGPDPHTFSELRRDHGWLKQYISQEIGEENVWELTQLLEEVFEPEDYHHRFKVLQDTLHRKADTYIDHLQSRGLRLRNYDPSELVKDLIQGYPRTLTLNNGRLPKIVIPPQREAMWIRDPVAVTPLGIVIGSMASSRRTMEPSLLRTVFKFHPMFDPDSIFLDMLAFQRKMEDDDTYCGFIEKYLFEGSNVIVISEDTLAIGVGQTDFFYNRRTTRQGFQLFVQKIFEADKEKKLARIYMVNFPDLKGFLHVDTVFNMMGPKSALVMPYIFGYPAPTSHFSAKEVLQHFVRWLRDTIGINRTDLSRIPTAEDFEHAGKVEVYDRDYIEKLGKVERLPQPSRYFLDQLVEDGWLDLNRVMWVGGEPDDYPSPYEHLKVALFDQANMAGSIFNTQPFHTIAYHRNPTTTSTMQTKMEQFSKNAHLELMSSNEIRTDDGGPRGLVLPLLRE